MITLAERSWWAVHGPLFTTDLDGEAPPGYVAWPDLATWAAFYGRVRDELYQSRPWLQRKSAAERLWRYIVGHEHTGSAGAF